MEGLAKEGESGANCPQIGAGNGGSLTAVRDEASDVHPQTKALVINARTGQELIRLANQLMPPSRSDELHIIDD